MFWACEGQYPDELAEVAREFIAKESGNIQPATIRNRLAYLRAAYRYTFNLETAVGQVRLCVFRLSG